MSILATLTSPLALDATAAHLLAQPVDAYALTTGRVWSVVGAVLGLAGIAIGGLALARSTGRFGRKGAAIALTAGLATAVIGGWIIAAAEGGPGTGYGIVGGYVDLAMALIALVLGTLALLRSRRTT
ncbi:DUF6223 family protein [Nonomuraea sp. NPDC004580]|uniref:DUF6223 family protein n=1 Tax=Nonomuraea sp. NPDC004580 TaxID=3154552 RepID=UPI0033B30F2D